MKTELIIRELNRLGEDYFFGGLYWRAGKGNTGMESLEGGKTRKYRSCENTEAEKMNANEDFLKTIRSYTTKQISDQKNFLSTKMVLKMSFVEE